MCSSPDPDVVLLDLQMPAPDGFEVMSRQPNKKGGRSYASRLSTHRSDLGREQGSRPETGVGAETLASRVWVDGGASGAHGCARTLVSSVVAAPVRSGEELFVYGADGPRERSGYVSVLP